MYSGKFQQISKRLFVTGGDGDIGDRQASFSNPYLQVFHIFPPFLCIFAGLYLYLVISEAYFPVFPDNQKILISFFQVPNAGGMKAAGSLHVSPNSINQRLNSHHIGDE